MQDKEILDMCNVVHGHKFDYKYSHFQSLTLETTVTCREHGDFKVTPSNHLMFPSGGCNRCYLKTIRQD